MYACFVYLLSYGAVHDLTSHARVGITLFILFLIHHCMNFWFYKTIGKGKWNGQRIALNVTDWILFALMITMAVSSVLMSGLVYEWSPIRTTQGYRVLHLASCCWGFMVMLVHLGIHLKSKLKKLEQVCDRWSAGPRKIVAQICLYVVYIAIIALGVYCFKESQIYVYMFNTGGWKLAASSLTVAALQLLGISAGMCVLTHLAFKPLR